MSVYDLPCRPRMPQPETQAPPEVANPQMRFKGSNWYTGYD